MENVFIESFHVHIFTLMPKRKSYFLFFPLNYSNDKLLLTYLKRYPKNNIERLEKNNNIQHFKYLKISIFFLAQNALSTQGTPLSNVHIITDVTQKMKRNVQGGTISNFLQPVEYRLSNISTCAMFVARARCIARILMNFNLIIVGVGDS